MQRGVKRSLADGQDIVGKNLNAFGDAPSMQRLAGDGVEDQQVESSLEQVGWLGHIGRHLEHRQSYLDIRQSASLDGRTSLFLPSEKKAEPYCQIAGAVRRAIDPP